MYVQEWWDYLWERSTSYSVALLKTFVLMKDIVWMLEKDSYSQTQLVRIKSNLNCLVV